ncbi:MAG: molybdopterin converting factor subunit 1 [SAR86 cluster bacterium]|uniref:Molybdopterin synthase sulfur carrier subunit n=1 Tax=SAR86 cluster bacterium TaxID=2030880 RepID=A0A2A5C826_9GAMM|nr:MAG: molybdopterin converting factor subunit 1 [SAR86 cluster bacterium]
MATIHYFASVREKLGLSSEQLELPSKVDTVSALVDMLIEQHDKQDGNWEGVLKTSSVLVAVNQSIAKFSSPIKDTDDIAFFPPVTGG